MPKHFSFSLLCAATWPARPSASTEARADETIRRWFMGLLLGWWTSVRLDDVRWVEPTRGFLHSGPSTAFKHERLRTSGRDPKPFWQRTVTWHHYFFWSCCSARFTASIGSSSAAAPPGALAGAL